MLNNGNKRIERGVHRERGGYRPIALLTAIALMLAMFSYNSLVFADDSITTEAGIAYAEGDIIVDVPDVSATVAADAPDQKYVQADEPKLPKAAMPVGWALLNLVLTIATGVIMLLLLITYFVRRRDGNPDYEENASLDLVFRTMTSVTTAAAAILFILTEDMRLPMILTDRYTLWHIAIAVVTIIFAVLSVRYREREDFNII